MKITNTVIGNDGKQCIVRYDLLTKNGNYDVMAIIGSDDGIRISSIDEIYYQFS